MRTDDKHPAIILSFPKRRGRPKSTRTTHDRGTPELLIKRQQGETLEALDLCLERRIINDRQHWCGIHLRWLYTLRYGAPGVRAIDTTHLGGFDITVDDPLWRGAREKEYHEAIALLAQSGHALLVMNLCIYNERPLFFKNRKGRDRVHEGTPKGNFMPSGWPGSAGRALATTSWPQSLKQGCARRCRL